MNRTFKQTLDWFCQNLSEIYQENELQSLYFLMMDDGFGYSKTYILTHYDSQVPETELYKISEIISRLQKHEPIQYILEKTTFCDLPFTVKSAVLIPRPETEELVQMILNENRGKDGLYVLDIGTGSGCIPISLAKNFENSKVTTIDVSEKCLEIAKANAQLNMVSVECILANILEENVQFQNLDIIVSNPPYVLDSEKKLMKSNVLEHEPHLALFVSDNDPLLFYRAIIFKAKKWLKPNGYLYFEINELYGNDIVAEALVQGFTSAQCFKDIFGKDRFVKIVK